MDGVCWVGVCDDGGGGGGGGISSCDADMLKGNIARDQQQFFAHKHAEASLGQFQGRPGEYFSLLKTLADQRLRIVGFNLEGAVVEWFRWMTRNGLITYWEWFKESVMNHFGPSKYKDPQGALSKLLQLGTVEEYQDLKEDVVESGDISILNSLIGQGSPRSLQLWGNIGSGLITEVDLYVLPLKGPDVVLGIQWLQKLRKVTHHYAQQTMEFSLANTTYSSKRDESLRMKRISLHHMQALLEANNVYGVYEVYSFTMVPTTLPPHRTIDHRIHLLPNTKPVNVRPYRYPHYQKGKMEKLVKEIMEQGIIRFSQSSFSSPVLLVKKKDGSYRFCVDYRALNEVTIKDKFLIPTADEMFDELGGVNIFTKLDLHEKRVKMDPKKVAAVMEWPVPTTQRQIRRFLGLTGYYRWFIKNIATVAAPLSQASILGLPSFEDMFIVEADASDVGIGAVIMQNGKPLCYFSRRLDPRMRLAATYQKELFAIVEAVYKWRQYLLGRCFTIHTDHRSLKELMQQYKIGTTNMVAGALARVYDAAFMALSQPLVSLVDDLRKENETLDELNIIHQKLERKEVLDGFRQEQGMILFRDHYFI
ncbi:retrotransposon-related protein [Tanacetum coccineum]